MYGTPNPVGFLGVQGSEERDPNRKMLCDCQLCHRPGGVSIGISPNGYDNFMRNTCRRYVMNRAIEEALFGNGIATARLPGTSTRAAATLEVRIKP